MTALTKFTDRSFRLPPTMHLVGAVLLAVVAVAAVTMLAHTRPWLGLRLGKATEGPGAAVLASYGPSAEIPEGTVLVSVAGDGDSMRIRQLDLTTEPDGAMGDFATYRRFLERQERLARIQSSEKVIFTAEGGRRFVVHPVSDGRPLTDLPPDFWVQCAVGLIAWVVSVAVFAFRRGEASTHYLLLSGAATLLFAPAAAVYTTRELAVPGNLLQWASDLNFLGGSLFAASFVALLLVYPRRIGPAWMGPAVVAIFVGWFIAQQVGLFESMTFARRFLVMVGVAVTFVLAGWHWHRSDRDPLARAKLQWFLLSWVVGTGAFALFILLPQTFGVDTSPIQGYAFLLFLLVYAGLALGILRYRLFELGDWWRRVIGWTAAVLLLVLLDLFFLYILQLSNTTSLAAALLICGLFWIPLRTWLWQHFADRAEGGNTMDLFRRVMNVAVAPDETTRASNWRELMGAVFEPLEITEAAYGEQRQVVIGGDGLYMELPAIGPLDGLRLDFAHGGRRLFRPRDAILAEELICMLKHGFESLAAYNKGKSEERGRIARDIHDNIGAHLLSALHNPHAERKDCKIRESLADLRQIINEKNDEDSSLTESLAELRAETAERLESAGIRLSWRCHERADSRVPRPVSHALRSIIREAASNTLRHSGADAMHVAIRPEADTIRIEVSDNGRGFDPNSSLQGNGLRNMRTRLDRLKGSLDLTSSSEGTRLKATMSLRETK